jgi:metal-responsive CopG/Arc/MetJ family transcriptional regulator
LIGLRNLYKVFQETRKSAREQATLAVTGDSERAAEIATALGAQRGVRGAEIILTVLDGGENHALG